MSLHDAKISKVNIKKTIRIGWWNLPSRYLNLVLKKESTSFFFFWVILAFIFNIYFYVRRKIKKLKRVYHKQYPDIAVIYRYTVWSMLWNFLFWHLFGGSYLYAFFFPKAGLDLVFFLKSISFFFSCKNVDIFLQEKKKLKYQLKTLNLLIWWRHK